MRPRSAPSSRSRVPPPATAGDATPADFTGQCEAVLEVGPAIVSSIMGVFPPDLVRRMQGRGVSWWATATTVAEARAAGTPAPT